MNFEIDPVAFRAWLQEHAEHMVGWTCNDKLSPISAWLRGRYQKEFFVTDESIVMGFFEACVATPQWASQFVRTLDAGRDGEEHFTIDSTGYIQVPQGIGIGFNIDREKIENYTIEKVILK